MHSKIIEKKAPAFVGVFLLQILFLMLSWPGLSGGFTLDDWPNLAALENIETQGFLGVVFEGISSTLGRPLSIFTFALQSDAWPDNPFQFKLVNVFLHIINSLLVFILARFLYRLYRPSSTFNNLFVLMVCGIWLFTPMHASTTFYVVQRMTLLAAFFSLLGVVLMLWGLTKNNGEITKRAFLGISAGVGLAFFAGVLSKENAILMSVLFPLSLVFMYSRNEKVTRLWRWWLVVFSLLPMFALVAYLVIKARFWQGYGYRDFTLAERLLTESRILWDYLFKIYLPTNTGLNINNDGYILSTSLLQPLSTLFAVLGWGLVALLAILKRKSWPFVFYGLFWFLGGHLLESTVLPLELYFEHRNYLPSLGLVILVVGCLFQLAENVFAPETAVVKRGQLNFLLFRIGCVFVAAWFIWSIVVLAGEVESWRSPEQMAIAALKDRPDSLRANQDAASYYANTGSYRNAAMMLHHIDQTWPGYPGTLAQKILLNCLDENVLLPSKDEMLKRFSEGPMDRGAVPALHEMLQVKKRGGCNHISWDSYRDYISALKSNKKFSATENLLILLAYSFNAQARFEEASNALDVFSLSNPSIGFMILSAQFAAMAGDVEKAQAVVELIEKRYGGHSKSWLLHSDKVEQLKKNLDLLLQKTDT